MPEALIEVKNIVKKYPNFALSDVSFDLKKGEALAVLGPNGSGKSTLMDIISGVVKYEKGSFRIFGKALKDLSGAERQKIGIIRDAMVFPENLNVNIFLKSVAVLFNNWNNDTVNRLLHKYEIDKSKRIKELSRGMRMKLWISIILSHPSEILLLDEPLRGMDINSRIEFIEALQLMKKEQTSIIFITHDFDNIESLCDKLLILLDGKTFFYGGCSEFISQWSKVEFDSILPDAFMSGMSGEIKNNGSTWLLNESADAIKKNSEYFKTDNYKISSPALKEILPYIFPRKETNE